MVAVRMELTRVRRCLLVIPPLVYPLPASQTRRKSANSTAPKRGGLRPLQEISPPPRGAGGAGTSPRGLGLTLRVASSSRQRPSEGVFFLGIGPIRHGSGETARRRSRERPARKRFRAFHGGGPGDDPSFGGLEGLSARGSHRSLRGAQSQIKGVIGGWHQVDGLR